MNKKHVAILILLVAMLLLTACAAGTNNSLNMPNEKGDIAGFWQGLWHGMIAPITFIISLFTNGVAVYDVHNDGGWYNFGFLLGVGTIGGSAGTSASRRRY